MSIRVFAPAKINLTLEVGRPRADGYHPLQSAVMFADVGDWIEASPASEVSLTITGAFAHRLVADESNLVLLAARLLDANRGAAITLEKNLPVASGIGGGSSDAAAALIALNELWALGRSKEDLMSLAAKLGADVPVCLAKHGAWITGTGETVARMRAPELHGVLVNPSQPLSTPAVYRRFDELGLGRDFAPRAAADWADQSQAFSAVAVHGNDLETPAVSLMPELGPLLQMLREDARAACAGLSGSGATCFALTRDAASAASLARDLAERDRDWWVRATTLGAA
jgi:4-diphosphocytidyl-2-C-methyl-D-erythritol kinase